MGSNKSVLSGQRVVIFYVSSFWKSSQKMLEDAFWQEGYESLGRVFSPHGALYTFIDELFGLGGSELSEQVGMDKDAFYRAVKEKRE